MLAEVGGLGVGRLSEGQKECLRLVLIHMTSKEIARHLGISSHTVDQRIRYAIRILGARSRMQAALRLSEAEVNQNSVKPNAEPDGRSANLEAQSSLQAPQPLMYQALDLSRRPSAASQLPSQPSSEPHSIPLFAFSTTEVIDRSKQSGRAVCSEPRTEAVPVMKPTPARESWAQNWSQPSSLRWYQKLLIILLIATMLTMSAGSLMVGIEALSELLK